MKSAKVEEDNEKFTVCSKTLIETAERLTPTQVSKILNTIGDKNSGKPLDVDPAQVTLFIDAVKQAEKEPGTVLEFVISCISNLREASKFPDVRREWAAKAMQITRCLASLGSVAFQGHLRDGITNLVIVCVTDNWSEVRKDTAKLLQQWPSTVPSALLEELFQKLVQICTGTTGESPSWKALEGCLLSLKALIGMLDKKLVEPEFFTSPEEKALQSSVSYHLGSTAYDECPDFVENAYNSCFKLITREEPAVRKAALSLLSLVQTLDEEEDLPQKALSKCILDISRCKEDYEFEGLLNFCQISLGHLDDVQVLSQWDMLCSSVGSTLVLGHAASTVRQAAAALWIKMASGENASKLLRVLLALSCFFDNTKQEEEKLGVDEMLINELELNQETLENEDGESNSPEGHHAARPNISTWRVKETILIAYEAILGALVSSHMKKIGRKQHHSQLEENTGDHSPSILEQLHLEEDFKKLSGSESYEDFDAFVLHITSQIVSCVSDEEFQLRRMAVQLVPTMGQCLVWRSPTLLPKLWLHLRKIDDGQIGRAEGSSRLFGEGSRVACELLGTALRHCRHLYETHLDAIWTNRPMGSGVDEVAAKIFKPKIWGSSHTGIGDSMIAQQSNQAVFQAAANPSVVQRMSEQVATVLRDMNVLLQAASQDVIQANLVAPGLVEVLLVRRAFLQGWADFQTHKGNEVEETACLKEEWDSVFCVAQLAAFHNLVYTLQQKLANSERYRRELNELVLPGFKSDLTLRGPAISLCPPCSPAWSQKSWANDSSTLGLALDRALSAGIVQLLPEALKSIPWGPSRLALYPFIAHWLRLKDTMRWVPCGGLVPATLALLEALRWVFGGKEQELSLKDSGTAEQCNQRNRQMSFARNVSAWEKLALQNADRLRQQEIPGSSALRPVSAWEKLALQNAGKRIEESADLSQSNQTTWVDSGVSLSSSHDGHISDSQEKEYWPFSRVGELLQDLFQLQQLAIPSVFHSYLVALFLASVNSPEQLTHNTIFNAAYYLLRFLQSKKSLQDLLAKPDFIGGVCLKYQCQLNFESFLSKGEICKAGKKDESEAENLDDWDDWDESDDDNNDAAEMELQVDMAENLLLVLILLTAYPKRSQKLRSVVKFFNENSWSSPENGNGIPEDCSSQCDLEQQNDKYSASRTLRSCIDNLLSFHLG